MHLRYGETVFSLVASHSGPRVLLPKTVPLGRAIARGTRIWYSAAASFREAGVGPAVGAGDLTASGFNNWLARYADTFSNVFTKFLRKS